jgi:hypothetical protein
MSAAAAAAPEFAKGLPETKVEMDPKLSLALDDDDDLDLSKTPAVDLIHTGIGGLAMALNLCPEAAQSAKRSKMIHKKGEVAAGALKLKFNVDYKAGSVVNIRVVTVKDGKEQPPAEGAPAEGGEDAAASSAPGEGGEEGAKPASAPVAGRKRARKEIDVKQHIELAVAGLKAAGKDAEAVQLEEFVKTL